MNLEYEYYNTDDDYDNDSVSSDENPPDAMWDLHEYNNNAETEELSSIPQIIDAGDGEYNVFRMIPYVMDDDRNIKQNCFMKIYNEPLCQTWWMNKMKKTVLNRSGNLVGIKRPHKNGHIYTWTYILTSSDDSDPNRWQLCISSQTYQFQMNERYCGRINVIVETSQVNRGKMTVSMNIKTSDIGYLKTINFYTQLTNSEYMSCIKI